jgi:ribosomal subunit interface protein
MERFASACYILIRDNLSFDTNLMHFDIKATNIKLTEGILAHVEKKLAPLGAKLKRFGEGVKIDVEVGLTSRHHSKGDIFRAEINVSVPPKKRLRATAKGEDLYVAVNEVKREMDRQIKDHKESLDDKKRVG